MIVSRQLDRLFATSPVNRKPGPREHRSEHPQGAAHTRDESQSVPKGNNHDYDHEQHVSVNDLNGSKGSSDTLG